MGSYDLIILDFYDTVMHMEHEVWIPRKGIPKLLKELSEAGKTLVICSDEGEGNLRQMLGGLLDHFAEVYGRSNLVYEEGTPYKNLERICEECGVPKGRAIFIGDNHMGTDKRSAERYGIKYIRVPDGREEHDYDFAQLIETLTEGIKPR